MTTKIFIKEHFVLDFSQAVRGNTQWFLALRKNVSKSYE